MTTIIFLVLFVAGFSFLCSLMEAVILSINSAYVAVEIQNQSRTGHLLEHLIEKIDRPLSAILTLNTVTNTMGSALIAYVVQQKYGELGVTIISIILTIVILFISEILPKAIGASHWKALAPISAYIIQAMILITYPAVLLTEKFGKLIGRNEDPEMTREEMIMTAEIGAEEGTIKNKESAIIKNLLMLDKIFVSDIMTPRSVFFALDKDLTVEEVAIKYRPIRYSRIPVYNETLDNIVGITHRYKILEALSHDHHKMKISEIVNPIASLPERTSVSAAIDFFIREKEHLALALDEYGVVTGIVTLEDTVETLLGVEIVDEFDSVEDLRKFALEQWQLRKQKIRKT
ncbi:MAG: CNNM domain-containing protein [Bdellovibrionota bacterium]